MNKASALFSRLKWIFSVSRRFARVDRKGRSAVTSILATAGICFGVMTLTVVMSIMNGFQMSFIDAIMEISSYHIRVMKLPDTSENNLFNAVKENKNILSVTEFYEAQTLMTGTRGKESAAIIRAVNPEIFYTDEGLKKEMRLVYGEFDISEEDTIILGSSLARNLGVHPGDKVNLFVLSGGNDVNLFSSERNFTVKGIFTSGYADIACNRRFRGRRPAYRAYRGYREEELTFSLRAMLSSGRFPGRITVTVPSFTTVFSLRPPDSSTALPSGTFPFQDMLSGSLSPSGRAYTA